MMNMYAHGAGFYFGVRKISARSGVLSDRAPSPHEPHIATSCAEGHLCAAPSGAVECVSLEIATQCPVTLSLRCVTA